MNEKTDTFKARLCFLFGTEAKREKIANLIGMKLAGFNRIWYENKIPKAETLLKIKQVTNCSIDWLLTGQGEPYSANPNHNQNTPLTAANTQAIDLTQYTIIPNYQHPNTAPIIIKKGSINNHIAQNLHHIKMPDDSMQPLIEPNDTIIINTEETTPYNGIYAIKIGETLQIKRLQIQPNSIKITAENKAYQPIETQTLPTDNLHIIGRVTHIFKAI
ncbi:MAG: helix-turn-helix transcriptional regulator [Neisseriaceae bacterium]|nr:helix-turn-helix transcriptional regulator [Neisseriaceae bacterium]MBQ9725835.1 helix-turn-helix transcriptional regulator [Neisseriaceae bacterium]MBR1818832.1 helix-turn-helix transcriptional regulator [Neisseriaceae bacterium]